MKKISRKKIEDAIEDLLLSEYDDFDILAMLVILKETINRMVADRKVRAEDVMEYELDTISRVTPVVMDYKDRFFDDEDDDWLDDDDDYSWSMDDEDEDL